MCEHTHTTLSGDIVTANTVFQREVLTTKAFIHTHTHTPPTGLNRSLQVVGLLGNKNTHYLNSIA